MSYGNVAKDLSGEERGVGYPERGEVLRSMDRWSITGLRDGGAALLRSCLYFVWVLFPLHVAASEDPPPAPGTGAPPAEIDFSHEVLPILKQHCSRCHTDGTYNWSFTLDTRSELLATQKVISGSPTTSALWQRVTTQDPLDQMPPEGPRLNEVELQVLKRWIEEGVQWPAGFSFKTHTYRAPLALRPIELPPPLEGRSHPVDRLFDRYVKRMGLTRGQTIDDGAFLRRVSLDVLGLLPSRKELHEFLGNPAADKRRHVIENLLRRKIEFTEHWLSFWNDLLRNDYSGTGYIDGGRRQITEWLYQSILQNKPYDLFVRELIAPTPASEGFIRGIRWRGEVNESQSPEMQFAQNVSQVFLGANLKCASCHGSFVDSWTLQDAYGMAAIVSTRPLELHRCDVPLGRRAQPRFLFPELGKVTAEAPVAQRLQETARLLTSSGNGRFTRTFVHRLWHRFFGVGFVPTIDAMDRRPFDEELLDYLAGYLVQHHYDVKQLMAHIATSEVYQWQCRVSDGKFQGPVARSLSAEQLLDAVWMLAGAAPDKPQAAIGAAALEGRRGFPVRASLRKATPFMRSLGRPRREQVVTERPRTLTPLQALELSNGAELASLLESAAAKLLQEAPLEPPLFVESLFERLLCRRPHAAELKVALQCLQEGDSPQAGLSELLWILVMLPEFQTQH